MQATKEQIEHELAELVSLRDNDIFHAGNIDLSEARHLHMSNEQLHMLNERLQRIELRQTCIGVLQWVLDTNFCKPRYL